MENNLYNKVGELNKMETKLYKADHRQRDLILKGFFTDKDYIGGSRRFSNLPLELLELILLENHTDHNEKHNNAPSIRDLIIFAKQMSEKGYYFFFNGYAISPKRDDYRVSVDTINIKYYFDNSNHLNNKIIEKFFKDADEKDLDNGTMRFWYD
jgi:hypothetical protein